MFCFCQGSNTYVVMTPTQVHKSLGRITRKLLNVPLKTGVCVCVRACMRVCVCVRECVCGYQ